MVNYTDAVKMNGFEECFQQILVYSILYLARTHVYYFTSRSDCSD